MESGRNARGACDLDDLLSRGANGPRDAALEFQVEMDGIVVNGIDLLKWNDEGQIVEFKVLIRPLKAINLIHQKMAAMLVANAKPNL